MDPVTTGIGGALLAKALPEKTRGPIGVWVVTGASLFPDIDMLAARVTGDPLASLTFHRGFTHSVTGVVLLAPALALVARATGKDTHYRRLLKLCVLALLWHIFTDLPTTWGTMVLWPFHSARIAWDWFFVLDLSYTSLLLAPHLLAWIYRYQRPANALHPLHNGYSAIALWAGVTVCAGLLFGLLSSVLHQPFPWESLVLATLSLGILLLAPARQWWGFQPNRTSFARLGLALFAVYVGLAAISHAVAVQKVTEQARLKGLPVISLAALPQPLSPLRWSGLVLTQAGVYQNEFNVLTGTQPIFRFAPSEHNAYADRARTLPEVQTYLRFARFPVTRYHNSGAQHVISYTDLRFHLFTPTPTRIPPFRFRVIFNSKGKPLQVGFSPQQAQTLEKNRTKEPVGRSGY